MSRTDRAVYRTLRHLAANETLLASAVGYEDEGRRRQVVLLTNQRVLVTGLRHDPPVELPVAAASAAFEPDPPRLTLYQHAEAKVRVRDIEADAARQVVAVLDDHRVLPKSASAPRVQHVHLHSDEPDEPDQPGR